MVSTPTGMQGIWRGQNDVKLGLLEDGVIVWERVAHLRSPIESIETFGGCWSVAITNVVSGQLSIRVGTHCHQPLGNAVIFIPPFTVMRWHLNPGRFKMVIYCDHKPLYEAKSENTLILKSISEIPVIQSRMDLNRILKIIGPEVQFSLRPDHIIVEKLKDYIDRTFTEEIAIGKMANLLNVNHALVTRYFKKTFGMSPIAYRNKLRVFASRSRLIQGASPISTVGFDVGFNSIRQFNREYKKAFRSTPSDIQTEMR